MKITKKLCIPDIKELKTLLLLAFFEPFLYFMGESYGLKYVSSTVGSVIVATIPLFALIPAWFIFREKIKLWAFIGILLSFIGVGFMVFNSSLELSASPLGVGLEFGAVFAAVGYTIILKKVSNNINNVSIIFYQNLFGAIYFIPLWFIFEFKSFIDTPFNKEAFIAIIELSIFATTLAFILFSFSIRQLGIAKSNMFINLIPIFTALFAWIILGDKLSGLQYVGISIVIAGLFLAQVKRKKRKHEHPPIPQS